MGSLMCSQQSLFPIPRWAMRKIACGMCVWCLFLSFTVPARADEDQVKTILNEAITASGGAEKLAKHESEYWKGKGTVHLAGQQIEFAGEWWVKPPDKFRNVISIDAGGQKLDIVQVVNGNKGWRSAMGNTEDMNDEQLSTAKEEMYAGRVGMLIGLDKSEFKLAPLGDSKVGNVEAVGLKVSNSGHKDISLYFDKKTHLLIKSQRLVHDEMSGQDVQQETIYGDYKDVDGVKRPGKLNIKRASNPYADLVISEYKRNQKLEDSLFGKPDQ